MKLRWLALLIVLVLLASSDGRADIRIDPFPDPPGERVSHKPIPNNPLTDNLSPEQLLARRLGGPRAQKTIDDNKQLNKDLQDLARKFLDDPELLKSLAKSVKPEDVARLKNSLGDMQGL